MIVPSTPTATDKFEQVRKMNIEIATLASARDIATKAFETARMAAADALERKNRLDADLASLDAGMSAVALEVREFVAHCRNILQAVVMTMEVASMQAKHIADYVTGMIEEIHDLEKKRDAVVASIAKENELMTVQRSDLDIYHQRIIAAAEKYLPGQPITI